MDLWQFNLRHLNAAAEICRLGSLSAAAEAVNLTQPAVTQAIAKLEAQLGLTLFDRLPSGMAPRDAARLLAPRIEAARRHVQSRRVTLAQVRALIAFAAAGSYAGASAATGLAQPTLHRAVSDLALALNRTLVVRRGAGTMLTNAGRSVVRGFRLAVAELEAGLSEIEALKGRETGRIAIGAMPLSRAWLLPAAVAAFHRTHPEVSVTIAEGSWGELIEPLRDGALDILLGALREPAPGKDVVQTPLFEDRPVVIGRAGHPLAGGGATIDALARYRWTVPAEGTPLRTQWRRIFSDADMAAPAVPVECGSVMVIRQMLLESDFLTLLSPEQVAVELEAGWLAKICDAPGLVRVIGMTTRTDWRATGTQAAFVDQVHRTAQQGIRKNL